MIEAYDPTLLTLHTIDTDDCVELETITERKANSFDELVFGKIFDKFYGKSVGGDIDYNGKQIVTYENYIIGNDLKQLKTFWRK